METSRSPTTLRRALAVLDALASPEAVELGGLTVTRLAEQLAVDKSQMSRTLQALAEEGVVDRDPTTRAFRLGWRLFAWAARAGDQRLRSLAAPLLARLVGETGETVYLTVRQGTQALTVAAEYPDQALRVQGWIGRAVPVASTASGRALLFDHDEDALRELLTDAAWTARTAAPASFAELLARLAEERSRGWAIAEEELEEGLTGIAAPVRDEDGLVVATVNVTGPRFRLVDRLLEIGDLVRRRADELSAQLGGPAAPAAPGCSG